MSNQENYILLKEILNEVDPIGLVDPETPESFNEYDPELKEILKENISQFSEEQLSQRVYEIFVQFFNKEIAGARQQYDSIASQFLAKRGHASP